MTPLVALVGAGPGDPDLLTVRAIRRLEQADLVLYDALLSPRVLACAPRARKVLVGKRAGRPGVQQATIHRLMIRAARRGQRVVRLKCGDPFVLGRGGEEVQALRAAGIAYEVVPGISAALAAPQAAGIPVTHRGLASGFVVVAGHDEATLRSLLAAVAPGALTVVVLMGLACRATLADLLLARGWSATTPAAIILDATHERQAVWTGTLVDLPQAPVAQLCPGAPGTIVVGSVVALGDHAFAEETVAVRAAAAL